MTKHDVLEWLSKEDESLYGECHGAILDELIRDGLASVRSTGGHKFYDLVSLTDAGWEALARPKS